MFLKPYDGSLSKDIYLINCKEELTDSLLNNPKLMFMEYINPKDFNEYTIDAYYDKNSNLSCLNLLGFLITKYFRNRLLKHFYTGYDYITYFNLFLPLL